MKEISEEKLEAKKKEIEIRFNLKWEQTLRSLDKKYLSMLGTRKEKLDGKRAREQRSKEIKRERAKKVALANAKESVRVAEAKKINMLIKKGETKKRKLRDTVKKVVEVKKKVNKTKIKQKAYDEVCKYAKLSRTDGRGMLKQIDTGNRVHRTECVGGHIFPKGNYKNMAFLLNNIWPISQGCNRKQADRIADWIIKTPLKTAELDELHELANDKREKAKILDTNFYQERYTHFKKLNEEIKEKLGEHYKKEN